VRGEFSCPPAVVVSSAGLNILRLVAGGVYLARD